MQHIIKSLFYAILAIFAMASVAYASVSTVEGVSRAHDDEKVVLDACVVRCVKHEHYIVSDKTGSVEVEIDDDILREPLRAGDRIRIYGEVDEDRHGNTVDADRIEYVQKAQ